jgi:hypothetical protein
MKQILSLVAIGMLSAWTTAAHNSTSGQTGASAQTQIAAQANNSGAQVSGSGSAAMPSATPVNANPENNSASISDGTKIDATLATSLDAKRSKPGDEVEARAANDVKQDGKVVLKRGTRLIGHVTQAQARVGGQTQSQLGIAFDRAVFPLAPRFRPWLQRNPRRWHRRTLTIGWLRAAGWVPCKDRRGAAAVSQAALLRPRVQWLAQPPEPS